MGWLSLNKPKEMTVEQYFQSERFFGSKSTILKSALINMREFYAAVKTGDEVWAFVALVDTKSHKWDRNNFSYKDMDETYLPYCFNCPSKILDMLSPTENERALKWRETCRQQIAKTKQLTSGVLVKFERPIRFTNGDELQVFKLAKGFKRGLCFQNPKTFTFYKISNWKKRNYEILTEVKAS